MDPETNFEGAYRVYHPYHERTRRMRGLESNPKITRGTKDPNFNLQA
jgi:hypothetical protein